MDLTSHFQDGGHDAISHRMVPPPGECTRSVCLALCSSVRQLLIYSLFVLEYNYHATRQDMQSYVEKVAADSDRLTQSN